MRFARIDPPERDGSKRSAPWKGTREKHPLTMKPSPCVLLLGAFLGCLGAVRAIRDGHRGRLSIAPWIGGIKRGGPVGMRWAPNSRTMGRGRKIMGTRKTGIFAAGVALGVWAAAAGAGCSDGSAHGTTAPDSAGGCTLPASSYDAACRTDVDCVAVFLGDVCEDVCHGACPNAAIHVTDEGRYRADLNAAPLIHASNAATECSCALGPAVCRDGACAIRSPLDDAGGVDGHDGPSAADAVGMTSCPWPASADTLGDASAGGCKPRPAFDICTVPNGSLVDVDGDIFGPNGQPVIGACQDACTSSEYALDCIGASPPAGGIPDPDPALGCKVIPIPTPSNALFYCCPCTNTD